MKEIQYNLGLVSVSFRQHAPIEIINVVKDTGLSCIEWGSDIHAPCDNIERLNEIAHLQKEYGIKCSSYGTYFRFCKTPIDELEKYIHAAKILGTDILRLWCGEKRGDEMLDSEKSELLSLCCQAAAIAESHGVTLCLECHKETFTENPDDVVWLIDAVNSSYFRMYWQPFQWQSVQENIENARKIAPYTENIHVFNWKGEQKLSLAESISEWQEYLRNFSSPRTLLLEFMPNGTIEELKSEVSALKSIIGGVL